MGDRQLFLTSQLTSPLGDGAALVAVPYVPDLHYFAGRGAKDVLPLYRDAAAHEPNVAPGLLEQLGTAYGRTVTPEDFAAYLYGVLAHPAFTQRFFAELSEKKLRVPLTQDADLFEEARGVGARLLRLHTYGERFVPAGESVGRLPRGQARALVAVPEEPENYPERFRYDAASQTLFVGGGEFAPVSAEVYGFEVSGLKVVQSWLDYRMRVRGGRRSSPLDDIGPERWTAELTRELLTLLWLLEATLEIHPQQADVFERILSGPLFAADELPAVPAAARRTPEQPRPGAAMLGGLDFDVVD